MRSGVLASIALYYSIFATGCPSAPGRQLRGSAITLEPLAQSGAEDVDYPAAIAVPVRVGEVAEWLKAAVC